MKRVRCAIYTRKSSDEGLDQNFNSSTRSVRRVRLIFDRKNMKAGKRFLCVSTTAALPAAIWKGQRYKDC